MGHRATYHHAEPDPNDPTTLIATEEFETVDTRDLADAKAEARGRLAAQLETIIAFGRIVAVNGVARNYQIDDVSRANVAGAATLALASLGGGTQWPSDFCWIAADNSHQPMSAADCLAFAQNIADYYASLVFANRASKDAIAALDEIAACDAFDVMAGWPPNP